MIDMNSDKTSVDLCSLCENNAEGLLKQSASPMIPFCETLVQSVHCAPIPEQNRWPLLPYQDPPGVGMRKTRELHGFEACPVSYRCHPGLPHPSVTPIRITPWIRPAPIIVQRLILIFSPGMINLGKRSCQPQIHDNSI